MKGKLLIILSGVALLHLFLLGGIALTGGCSSSDDEQPINDQNYVPVPEAAPAATTAAPAPAPVADLNNTQATPGVGMTVPEYQPMVQPSKGEKAAGGEQIKYTIQKGDSLWRIAKKFGVSVDEITSYNQISAKSLKVGQTITIPPGGRAYAAGEKVEFKPVSVSGKKSGKKSAAVGTVSPDAKAEKAEGKHAKTEKTDAKAEEAHAAGASEYAVQKGDTLDKIAHKFHVKAADLASANNISVDKMLHVGQKLTIPKSSAVASKTEGAEKADAKGEKTEKADAKDSKSSKKHAKGEKTEKADKAADKTGDKTDKSADKPATPAKTGDSLLDEIPSPDEGSAAPTTGADASVKPLASNAALKAASAVAGEKAVSSGYTAEVDQDTTVEKLATQYGCKAEDIKKLNPELADGKVKAGSVVKIP